MEAADSNLGQGIGARLRRAREERNLSVEECAERLYVSVSVLRALEDEQYALLGAGVYARGHLRRYAGLLELDAAGLEQTMLQRLAALPDLSSIVTRRFGVARPKRSLGLLPVAIVAAVLALAVLVWWSARHSAETKPAPTPVATPVPTPGTGSATAAPPGAALPAPKDTVADTAAPARAPAAPLVVAEADPRGTRPAVSPPTPATTASPAVAATAPTTAGAGDATVAPRRRAQPRPLQPPPPAAPRDTQRDYMNFDN